MCPKQIVKIWRYFNILFPRKFIFPLSYSKASFLSSPLKYFHFLFQVFYNKANVKQVDVPSFSGSFGILPEHVPLLAVLQPGVLTVIEEDGVSNKYFGKITLNYDI